MRAIPQVRVARATLRLAEVARFYERDLGLPRVAAFEGHAGYSGVVLAIPGTSCHLELTQHEEGGVLGVPTGDDLLVLYFGEEVAWRDACARMRAAGHAPVEPENPWWRDEAETYEDPDGWRVVLARDAGVRPKP